MQYAQVLFATWHYRVTIFPFLVTNKFCYDMLDIFHSNLLIESSCFCFNEFCNLFISKNLFCVININCVKVSSNDEILNFVSIYVVLRLELIVTACTYPLSSSSIQSPTKWFFPQSVHNKNTISFENSCVVLALSNFLVSTSNLVRSSSYPPKVNSYDICSWFLACSTLLYFKICTHLDSSSLSAL